MTKAQEFAQLIKQWLDDEIDNEIEFDGRDFTLEYAELRNGSVRYEVWEDGELIAYNDNYKDFLTVWTFIDLETV
jgi:hypothetical protein